jgi:DNA-binding response OmpR family regulator
VSAEITEVSTWRVYGDLAVDIDAREVQVDGNPITLTKLEFDVLIALCASPRVVLSREELISRVWGPGWFGDEHVIDVHLSNLRRKLGDNPKNPRFVRTVRGVGFKLAA